MKNGVAGVARRAGWQNEKVHRRFTVQVRPQIYCVDVVADNVEYKSHDTCVAVLHETQRKPPDFVWIAFS